MKTKPAPRKQIALPKLLLLFLNLYEKNFFSLIAWSVLVFGGMIMLFHFLYIRHFPALDLPSSVGLLTVIAVTGLTIILYLSFSLIIPLIIWSMFFEVKSLNGEDLDKDLTRVLEKDSQVAKSTEKEEESDVQTVESIASSTKHQSKTTPIEVSTEKTERQDKQPDNLIKENSKISDKTDLHNYAGKTSFMFAAPVFISFLGIVAEIYLLLNNYISDAWYFFVFLWLIVPISSGVIIYFALYLRHKYPRLGLKHIFYYIWLLLISIIMYTFTPVTAFVLYFSRYATSDFGRSDESQGLILVIVLSVSCLIFNGIIFASLIENRNTKEQGVLRQLGFGLLLLTLIIMASQSWFSIPQAVLRMYGLADVENVSVVFDEKGCSTIRQIGIRHIYNDKDKSCSINHAAIVSDVGSDRYISSEEMKRFTISKTTSTIVENSDSVAPRQDIETTLTQTIGKDGKLKKANISIKENKSRDEENKSPQEKLSVYIVIVNGEGKLLSRFLLAQNINFPSEEPFQAEFIVPDNLAVDGMVWCDLEVIKNGVYIKTKWKRDTLFN